MKSHYANRSKRRCIGGPLNEQILYLEGTSTLTMNFKGVIGYYHSAALCGDIFWRPYVNGA